MACGTVCHSVDQRVQIDSHIFPNMDTNSDGQPAGSYEERNDLAIRSAASDPLAEPRANPQPQSPKSPKSSHTKQASISRLQEAQVQPSSKQKKSKDNGSSAKGALAKQVADGPLPNFIVKRNELFDKLKRQSQAERREKEKPEINVVIDLGLDEEGKRKPDMPAAAKAWETTPGIFLRHLDKDVASEIVVAKVDGQLWDLDRPLERPCRVSYISFSTTEGRNVFWHSSAHVLGEAAECQYNCLLSHGPPVDQGFFYDMKIQDE